ncbi:DUF2442 domain-containing protein [Blastochloris sulfoviridis]|uniref:DUF2442 domain-containing protein n=1 Tax=Blastochloris sulfoviridis TaxID=50712 RepID=A0A5M6I2G6_9HYPH|nr:DUF2442 domain-containing protein [Blastochloris sulfoviridis]KAA5602381.1 DUF2442 domain-containing protein [Blastochloris sulfoviridis]
MIQLVKVVAVRALERHHLWVRFSDGTEGVRPFTDILDEGGLMVEPLRDPAFFARVFVEMGVPTWPNGFAVDALALHQEMALAGQLSPAAA